MPIDKRAVSQWRRAQSAYQHYRVYIGAKPNRHALTFTDLVYVKNFKGGSATIAEPVATFGVKIEPYEEALQQCAADPGFGYSLTTVPAHLYPGVRHRMINFASLPNNSASDISGFGESFATALLHFYFPTLVPILDKRALNGSGVKGISVDRYNNVTNLLALYPALIDAFRGALIATPALTLRDVDQQWFSQTLNVPPFH